MTLPTHILLGGVIAKLTGNPVLAISVSVLIDIDHVISYVKSGVIFSPKKFWKTVTDKNDPYGDQRGYLHNVFIAVVICALFWVLIPSVGLTFALAYLGHLTLDALDKSDYWPLYPSKKINIKGFVGYYSKKELFVILLLLLILLY
jgi:membrane-bound metal-dependent hydrolase YbcI (DUF457 family)